MRHGSLWRARGEGGAISLFSGHGQSTDRDPADIQTELRLGWPAGATDRLRVQSAETHRSNTVSVTQVSHPRAHSISTPRQPLTLHAP